MHARPRTRRIAPSAAALVAVAALLAACSDDGPKIDERADRRLLREVALTVDDLPDGFVEQDDDDDDDADDVFADCGDEVGIDADEVEDNRVAEAGDDVSFVREDEASFTQIRASVVSLRDRGLATRQIEAFEDDDFFDCVVDGLEDEIGENDQVSVVDIDTIDPAVDGDAAAAIAMEIESGGFTFELQLHMVLVDRFGFTVQAMSGPDGLDEDLVDDAFDAMLDRLEDEQG